MARLNVSPKSSVNYFWPQPGYPLHSNAHSSNRAATFIVPVTLPLCTSPNTVPCPAEPGKATSLLIALSIPAFCASLVTKFESTQTPWPDHECKYHQENRARTC